jgi:hypothetical protein
MGVADRVPMRLQRAAHHLLPEKLWAAVRDLGVGDTPAQRRLRARRLARATRRARARSGGEVIAVQHADGLLAARVVDRFRSGDVLAANAAFVLDALEQHNVPYAVIEAGTNRRRVVAVSDRDSAAAVDALRTAAAGRPVYARPLGAKAVPIGRLNPAARPSKGLRVFEAYGTAAGDALSGSDLGCDVECWTEVSTPMPALATGEPVEAGALLAPRPNRWIDVLHVDDRRPEGIEVDGVRRTGIATFGRPLIYTTTFPIDAVYTWVDGDDPRWQARKRTAYEAAGLGSLHEFAIHPSRFTSHDELRYSMRSLDMYADWIRQVYLVTDDQVPDWLDTSHPKIRVVSHQELFGDRGASPTFNSHAIESQLHHVDGLADHYIYLNDDVFFGRAVTPEHFFHSNGIARFFPSKARLGLGSKGPDDMPAMSAGKNNRDLLVKMFDVLVTNKFRHVPHAQCKQTLLEMEERFPEVFAETAAHQFRTDADYSIAASLHHSYGYLTGRAMPGNIRYGYADIAAPTTPAVLRRWLRTRAWDVFCLNDHDSSAVDPEEQAELMQRFLSTYFPLASSFEK